MKENIKMKRYIKPNTDIHQMASVLMQQPTSIPQVSGSFDQENEVGAKGFSFFEEEEEMSEE